MEKLHHSIMVKEVLETLKVSKGGRYADLTFGEGGHTAAFLEAGAGEVVAWDRDPEALAIYKAGGTYRADSRLTLHHGRFSEFSDPKPFDGILMDLGVSTRQLLKGERGFSFNAAGPLDMRMNGGGDEPLSEMLSRIDERELAREIEKNTDLPRPLNVAREILAAHSAGRLQTTADLAKVIGGSPGKRHPATVIFLALRMWVNDEFGEVERAVPKLVDSLKPGGRMAIITFHSTEDRLVKNLFKGLAGKCVCPPEVPICQCPKIKRADIITKKPMEPSRQEQRQNPRSRSAKLRVVERMLQ